MPDITVEQRVIGAVLSQDLGEVGPDPADVAETIAMLSHEDFTDENHQAVWREVRAIINAGEPLDESLVASRACVSGAYLAQLTAGVPTMANLLVWARIVRNASLTRLAAAAMSDAARQLAANEGDTALLGDLVASVARLEVRPGERQETIAEIMRGLCDEVRARAEGKSKPLSTGYSSLDHPLAGGLRPGELFVIGGRPGSGKSAIAMNMARRMATMNGRSVWVASCEMKPQALAERMVAEYGGIDSRGLKTGRLSNDEWQRLASAAGEISTAKIGIKAFGLPSAADIRAGALRFMAENNGRLDCIVVDYLQRLRADGRSRVEQVANISIGVKAIALDLDIPVIALAQLNRSNETASRKPIASDLKESGQIEQDADVIMLLHRDDGEREVECIFAKQRDGGTGFVKLGFTPECVRFD